MILKEYYEKLKELIDKHPEALEYGMVYSCDDEGNRYSEVCYTPSIGWYDYINEEFMRFTPPRPNKYPKAICIN